MFKSAQVSAQKVEVRYPAQTSAARMHADVHTHTHTNTHTYGVNRASKTHTQSETDSRTHSYLHGGKAVIMTSSKEACKCYSSSLHVRLYFHVCACPYICVHVFLCVS